MDGKTIGKIVGAGVAFEILALIINTLGAFLTMGFYQMPEYFAVWSKAMMPAAGPPPMSFYIYSIGFGIIAGLIYAAVYNKVKNSVPGTGARRGLYYGGLLFLVAGIPFALNLYLLINLPVMLLAWWAVFSLIIYLIGGAIIGAILK